MLHLRPDPHLNPVGVQKFFREKTAITHELVRKHAELQANAKKKDEELSQLRMAGDGLQSQLEAVQTASEVTASVPIERWLHAKSSSVRPVDWPCECHAWPSMHG